MKLEDQIRLTTELQPFYNETFWELQYPEDDAFNYMFSKIFHYDSLTNTFYRELRAVHGSPLYMWLPERQIKNTESKLFHENKQFLIDNKVRCIKCVDGYFWVVNDDAIRDALKDRELPALCSVAATGQTA